MQRDSRGDLASEGLLAHLAYVVTSIVVTDGLGTYVMKS